MSVETWKLEFYPVPARECEVEEAVAHSLRKWKGLRAEARVKHGVHVSGVSSRLQDATSAASFPVNAVSCALCEHFFTECDGSGVDDKPRCNGCPLAQARKGHPCDEQAPNEARAPWQAWEDESDPEPMIAALEAAARMEAA